MNSLCHRLLIIANNNIIGFVFNTIDYIDPSFVGTTFKATIRTFTTMYDDIASPHNVSKIIMDVFVSKEPKNIKYGGITLYDNQENVIYGWQFLEMLVNFHGATLPNIRKIKYKDISDSPVGILLFGAPASLLCLGHNIYHSTNSGKYSTLVVKMINIGIHNDRIIATNENGGTVDIKIHKTIKDAKEHYWIIQIGDYMYEIDKIE